MPYSLTNSLLVFLQWVNGLVFKQCRSGLLNTHLTTLVIFTHWSQKLPWKVPTVHQERYSTFLSKALTIILSPPLHSHTCVSRAVRNQTSEDPLPPKPQHLSLVNVSYPSPSRYTCVSLHTGITRPMVHCSLQTGRENTETEDKEDVLTLQS